MRKPHLHAALLALMVSPLLVGCGSATNTVIKYNTKVVAQDDAQLVDCDVTPPPSKQSYMARVPAKDTSTEEQLRAALATEQERSRQGLAWGQKQTENLIRCNVRWQGARQHKAQSIQQIEALDKTPR